jgi:hypothetical protein
MLHSTYFLITVKGNTSIFGLQNNLWGHVIYYNKIFSLSYIFLQFKDWMLQAHCNIQEFWNWYSHISLTFEIIYVCSFWQLSWILFSYCVKFNRHFFITTIFSVCSRLQFIWLYKNTPNSDLRKLIMCSLFLFFLTILYSI